MPTMSPLESANSEAMMMPYHASRGAYMLQSDADRYGGGTESNAATMGGRRAAGGAGGPAGGFAPPGSPAGGPGNLQGLNSDIQGQLQQRANEHFAGHWGDLTKGLDTSNNQAVEGLAKQYGVTRGRVGMNGNYSPMTNEELLAATKQTYRNSPAYAGILRNDPAYQAIQRGTDPSTVGAQSRRLRESPLGVVQNQAQATGATNAANAVASDAGNRTTLANAQSGLMGTQGTVNNSIAGVNSANAGRISAMTPGAVAGQNLGNAAQEEQTRENRGKFDAASPYLGPMAANQVDAGRAANEATRGSTAAAGAIAPSVAARNYAAANAPTMATDLTGNPVALPATSTYGPPASPTGGAPSVASLQQGPPAPGALPASPAAGANLTPSVTAAPAASPAAGGAAKGVQVGGGTLMQDPKNPAQGVWTDPNTGLARPVNIDTEGNVSFGAPGSGQWLPGAGRAPTPGWFGATADFLSHPLTPPDYSRTSSPASSPAPQSAGAGLPGPQQKGAALDPNSAATFLKAAGGDKNRARALAKQAGWRL